MYRFLSFLESARKDLEENKSRYFVSCFIMLWKVLLIFGLMMLNELSTNGATVTRMMFTNFTDGFHSPTVPITRVKQDGMILDNERHQLYVELTWWPLIILAIHIGITYLTYAFGKFTCKVCIQEISFAIPVTIAVPVTVSFLWAFKNLEIQDKCQLTSLYHPSQYIFWNMGTLNSLGSFSYTSSFSDGHGWLNILVSVLWFICLVSQIASTLHIWKETSERLASTELLFVSPMYNAALIDQSLAMNRRSLKLVYDGEEEAKKEKEKPKKSITDPEEADFEHFNKEKLLDANNNHANPLYHSSSFGSGSGTQEGRKKSGAGESADFSDVDLKAEMLEADEEEYYAREWARICAEQGMEEDSIDAKPNPKEDDTIRIYACATMWHEDRTGIWAILDHNQPLN